jgi:hypothetical protein
MDHEIKTLEYKIHIKAIPEKVWKMLWEPDNYSKWTATFSEGGFYKTDAFVEGNKIQLLSREGGGMYSVLDKIIENKYLRFKHIGEMFNFEELPIEGEAKLWTGSIESYELIEIEKETVVVVLVETFRSYIEHMDMMFPKALEILKTISE